MSDTTTCCCDYDGVRLCHSLPMGQCVQHVLQAEKIARVYGHLEGYASMVAKQPVCFAPLVDRGKLVEALREDAATLAALLDPPETEDA